MMSRLAIVVFGATGFTGKKAVEELARVSTKHGLTWAVAGRSQSKLENLISDVSKIAGADLSHIKIIVADISDEASLNSMCSQAKVLVNCCGPYRLYGEPVVKAAVENKTHYVDVSGEPEFIETMQLKYNAQAKEAGVYIVSACGFDSIPNDMGVVYLEKMFNGTLNSVESYLSTYIKPEYRTEAYKSGCIHYGTWESLIHSLANWTELSKLRKKLYPERLPSLKPKLQPRSTVHKKGNRWCLPFPGADASVVYRTQRFLYENENKRPVQFKPYVKIGSLLLTLFSTLVFSIIGLMCMTKFTRSLLLKYPRFFSLGMITHDGPKEEVMNNTLFKFDLYGDGWEGDNLESQPNKKMAVRVSGVNPGYGATVTALIYSAITILEEQDKLPSNGGVYTTGVAFRNTSLISNLNENNLKFEVIDAK